MIDLDRATNNEERLALALFKAMEDGDLARLPQLDRTQAIFAVI